MFIHKLADVQTIQIGANTHVWQFAVLLKGCVIGDNCNINCHTFVENNVIIGNNVTIKPGVYLWDGTYIEDNVFVGPNVTFTNDKYPRSKQYPASFQQIILQNGCSIGANATILGGVTIGKFAIVAAHTLITNHVPAFALVKGVPGKIAGWVNKYGKKLLQVDDNLFIDEESKNQFAVVNNILTSI
jgi:UDP-2-acetamido-3-amino-2,3-dideoxy-glucuronate N-acetyltransferase